MITKDITFPECRKAATSLVVSTAIILLLVPSTNGHGRLLDPPSRQSAWRDGFKTPINYDDHGRNCGGRGNQWDVNGGRCGICGDPAQGPLWYERPDGLFVQHDVITRNYTEGQTIDVRVFMTVNHWGWFEFRICDIATTGGVEATQECLDQTLLADATGETRFPVSTDAIGFYNYTLLLPENLVCRQCMIQWKWHCGNSPGYGEAQEEFYACSDVSIWPRNGALATSSTRATTHVTQTSPPATPATTTRTPITITSTKVSPIITRYMTTPTTTTRYTSNQPPSPAIIDNDDILGYFLNQATKQPNLGNPGKDSLPRPKPLARYGMPDTSEEVYSTLCMTCIGNGCRYAGCNRLCQDVCF